MDAPGANWRGWTRSRDSCKTAWGIEGLHGGLAAATTGDQLLQTPGTRRCLKPRTFSSTVSPRNSCSVSMVFGWRATTELSSFTASSTTRRFGEALRCIMAVEKSFLVAGFAASWEGPASAMMRDDADHGGSGSGKCTQRLHWQPRTTGCEAGRDKADCVNEAWHKTAHTKAINLT